MVFTPLLRQSHLSFTLTESRFLRFGFLIVTGRATDAGLVFIAGFVCFGNRKAAGMALVIAAFFELMVNAHAVVENKTLATP